MTPLQKALSNFKPPFKKDYRFIYDSSSPDEIVAQVSLIEGKTSDKFGDAEIIAQAIAEFLNSQLQGKPEFICEKCGQRQNDTHPKTIEF